MNKERKMKKIVFTSKFLDDFQGLPLLLNFFVEIPDDFFPWFCFGIYLFPEGNQQPILGGERFSKEK